MQSNNAEDEHQRKDKHNNGVDLETGALVRVQPYHRVSQPCLTITPMSAAIERG